MKQLKLTGKAMIAIVFLLVMTISVKAQSFVEYQATSQSSLSIKGTSTLHDWEMKLQKLACTVKEENQTAKDIVLKDIHFEAKVNNLKSGESSIMDNKAYKAMKEDKYPTISFTSQSPVTLTLNQNKFNGTVSGWLTIAGDKKEVKLNIQGNTENGEMSVTGVYPMKMSEFGIKPPTAMFGAIKSGDAVKVHFNISLQKKSISSLK
jgi:polyisoprenoid-binding protein YceI